MTRPNFRRMRSRAHTVVLDSGYVMSVPKGVRIGDPWRDPAGRMSAVVEIIPERPGPVITPAPMLDWDTSD